MEVTLKSFPFDSMEVLNEESGQLEDDRLYEAEIFRKYFSKFLSNGVYYGHYKNLGENSMKVTLDTGLNIKVLKGAGIIEGADFELEEDTLFVLSRPTEGNRIDRVVVKFDNTLSTRETKLYIKEGKGTIPAELQRDENIYEICIGEVTVKSTSNITADDIKDTRPNSTLCGIVNSLITVDGEELYQSFKDYIETVKKNLMVKNEDNVCEGKITAKEGFDGNSSTATKLKNSRKISLIGDVTGSADFDGSKDVNINSKLNTQILTGTITIGANQSNGEAEITYPNGFNIDNTYVLDLKFELYGSNIFSTSVDYPRSDVTERTRGAIPGYVSLFSNKILVVACSPYEKSVTTSEMKFNYKVLLLKK